jgi:hypothetical protein
MEARGIRLQGELGISRQPIAQGMPGCSGCTCMLVCVFPSALLHTRPWVQQAPGIPCALSFRANEFAKLGHRAARTPTHIHMSSPGLTGRPSIPEAAVIEPIGRSVLDPPHARGMTIEWCVAISASLRAKRSNPLSPRMRRDGLLRGACHRARIRATRWLAMTAAPLTQNNSQQIAPASEWRLRHLSALILRNPLLNRRP